MTDEYGFIYATYRKSLNNRNSQDIGFSSLYNTLKTFKSGIISKAVAGSSSDTISVAHGLGYRPAFNAYFRDTLSGEVYPIASGFEDINFGRSGAEINVHGKSDNANVIFVIFNNNAASRNVDIFYEVFYEDLVSEPQFFVG